MDPWMAGRMGGTGKDSSGEYKVRDTRKLMPGAESGRPGLTRKERRAIKKDIRSAAREARTGRQQTGRLVLGVAAVAALAGVVAFLAIAL